MKTAFVLGYVTTRDKKQAVAIGRALIKNKLAGCVNILPLMHSIYCWEGKVESTDESVLVIKTTKSKMKKVTALVTQMHSSKVPCVIFFPISHGHQPYLNWLEHSLKP